MLHFLMIPEFCATFLCKPDLWISQKVVLLLLNMSLNYIYYIHVLFILVTNSGGRVDIFYSSSIVYLFVNFDRQVVLWSRFVSLFWNCLVPFLHYPCTDLQCFVVSVIEFYPFFIKIQKFVFSDFKTILLHHHFIPFINFSNFFIVDL